MITTHAPFDTLLRLDARIRANSLADEARERAQTTLTHLIRQLGSGEVLILVLALLKLLRDLDSEIKRWEAAVTDRQRAFYEARDRGTEHGLMECAKLSAQQTLAHHHIARLHGLIRDTKRRINPATRDAA